MIQLPKWDYKKKQQALAFVVLIGMIVGEFLFIILMTSLTTRLSMQLITKEQYQEEQSKLGSYIGIYAIGLIISIVILAVWLKVSQVEHEKEEIVKDSHQGPIQLDAFDTHVYLIQTEPDSAIKVKSTEDMKRILEKTEVFQSLVKSIDSGVEGFSFDQSNFFKQMFDKDIENLKKNLPKKEKEAEKEKDDEKEQKDPKKTTTVTNPSVPIPENPDGTNNSPELVIDFKAAEPQLKEFVEKSLPNLFSPEQYAILKSDKLFLYYRTVLSIKRVDDPNIDPEDEDDIKKDRLGKIRGMFYLLPAEEKAIFDYRRRKSPLDETLQLRKTYIQWRFVKTFSEGIAFFIDYRLIYPLNIAISDKTVADSRAKALTFLTHLAVDRDQELRDENLDLRTDIINSKRELDKKRDQELSRMLHDGELESFWRNRFTFSKLNATALVFALALFVLGIFVGMTFFSSKSPTINGDNLSTTSTKTKGALIYSIFKLLFMMKGR